VARSRGCVVLLGKRIPKDGAWAAVVAASIAYLGIQVRQTVKDRNAWPFCAYNMFNYYLPDRFQQARVVLATDRGELVGPADPWPLLPLEFFRVISIIERVFITCEDRDVRDDFCRRVLHRLNTRPWRDWDEIRGSFRPPAGQRFAGLELYLVDVDFTRCDPVDRTHVLSADLVHRHDPEGVFAGRADRGLWRFVDGPAEPPAAVPQPTTPPVPQEAPDDSHR
jgi:hypothetical protein